MLGMGELYHFVKIDENDFHYLVLCFNKVGFHCRKRHKTSLFCSFQEKNRGKSC